MGRGGGAETDALQKVRGRMKKHLKSACVCGILI